MVDKINCRLVSWQDVYSMCEDLANKIKNSGYVPDTLIAIARSGFVPGRIMSDLMGVTDLVSLKVEHWLDTTAQHKDEATIPYEIPFRIEGKKTLVIDDIVDTGKSMAATKEYLAKFSPAELKTAVMQYITTSELKPDFFAETVTEWTWFVYPWNTTEDFCNLGMKVLTSENKAWDVKSIREAYKANFAIDVDEGKLMKIMAALVGKGKVVSVGDGWQAK